ncbi:hypothetical protein PYW07_015164 [Mythimna separata]|uniref:TIL domain-containing protein n=1 Tax=Mythimna separata TaxID=271217 RepID=A0AAD7YWT9_MYTSE|nr:hypothetical protein PYW07_015164 [Mythimna separata]
MLNELIIIMLKFVVLLSCCIVLSVGGYRSGYTNKRSNGNSGYSTQTGSSSPPVQPRSSASAVQARAIGPINCTQPNEHYECGSACQTECATLGQQCPIVNVRCNDACYCNTGYARNSAGTCIPISQC